MTTEKGAESGGRDLKKPLPVHMYPIQDATGHDQCPWCQVVAAAAQLLLL